MALKAKMQVLCKKQQQEKKLVSNTKGSGKPTFHRVFYKICISECPEELKKDEATGNSWSSKFGKHS